MPNPSHPVTAARIPFRRRILRFVRSLAPVAGVLVGITSFRSAIADWNTVPTGSMNPTIVEGDVIAVNKLAYDLKVPYTSWRLATWRSPARGDIVVFPSPKDGTRLVKRVVALAGDTVELDANEFILSGSRAAYTLSPSGQRLETAPFTPPHAIVLSPMPAPRARFGPFTVPPGHVFMMGDNRDRSFDSRYFGPVPIASITGRAFAVPVSFKPDKALSPRWDRTFTALK
jgi:signal peptidase I